MQEPAACGALPAQQVRVHIEPLAITEEGMLADRIASNSVDPRITLETRIAVEPKLCLFIFGTDRSRSHGILSRPTVTRKVNSLLQIHVSEIKDPETPRDFIAI
jgi:hypothetical protein